MARPQKYVQFITFYLPFANHRVHRKPRSLLSLLKAEVIYLVKTFKMNDRYQIATIAGEVQLSYQNLLNFLL